MIRAQQESIDALKQILSQLVKEIAQSEINLLDGSCLIEDQLGGYPTGDEPSGGSCPTKDEPKGCGCLYHHSQVGASIPRKQTEVSERGGPSAMELD